MSDMREQDHPDILKAMGTLANKKVKCEVEGCIDEAKVIIKKSPLCDDHAKMYKESL